jgi:hypothetical protein
MGETRSDSSSKVFIFWWCCRRKKCKIRTMRAQQRVALKCCSCILISLKSWSARSSRGWHDSAMNIVSRVRISGRGFLGLSQNGVSAHEFWFGAQCRFIKWGRVYGKEWWRTWWWWMRHSLIVLISISNWSPKQLPATRTLDTMVAPACTLSALITVVSARWPTHEERSVQDRDDRVNMLLGSIGEAVHHQIDCLRCCGSHGGQDSESFGFVEQEVCGPSTTMLSRG